MPIKKIVKYLFYCLIALVGLLTLVVLFISPIAEYLIEKYDTKYVGREIEIGKLHLNIFNGKVELNDLKIYEAQSNALFFKTGLLFVQINPYKAAFKQQYDVKTIQLTDYELNIIQTGSHFNFDDLLALGSTDSTSAKPNNEVSDTTRWWLRQIELNSGQVRYNDKLVGIKAGLQSLRIFCPGLAYNKADMRFLISSKVTSGGRLSLDFKVNTTRLFYQLHTNISNLGLNPFYPYLREVFKANDLQGFLNTTFLAKGNFNAPEDLALKGNLGISNFKVIDVLDDSLALFKQLNVSIDSINLKRNIFNLRNIELNEPYVKVDLFENGTNFNRLMKVDTNVVTTASGTLTADSSATKVTGSSTNIFIIIADYVKSIAQNYILNSYSADQVTLRNGVIDYSDFTLGEQFYARLDSLTLSSSRISSENSRISAALATLVNRKGKLLVEVGANPKDFLEMELKTEVKNVPLVMFNPYTLYYLAHPFKKGGFNFNTLTTINAAHDLKSENHLFVEKVKVGRRDKAITSATKVPLRMGVALLKDTKGNIDFKFPVSGNLNDPKYKLNKVILKIFQNLLLKAVTSPFKAIGSLFKKKEQETEFEFEYLQFALDERLQQKIIEKVVELAKDKTELVVEFTQNVNPDKEMEVLIYREAKKIFMHEKMGRQFTDVLSEQDVKDLKQLQNKDSSFVSYIQSKTTQLNTLASHLDKCRYLVGAPLVKKMHEQLITQREAFIAQIFEKAAIDKQRLIFVRNISRKANMNQVKPSFSFELDTKDDEIKN